MSDWMEDSAKVSIKEEFRDDFQSMLEGRFRDIKDEELRNILVPAYTDFDKSEHEVIKGYLGATEYKDGIFTFSVSYNHRNRRLGGFAMFQRDLIFEILPIVVDYVFYHHSWYENDTGSTGPVEWTKENYKGWTFGRKRN